MDKPLENMIQTYMEDNDFFGAATEEQITRSEIALNLRFPVEYREFVKTYGSGGVCGVELAGIEGDLGASAIKATERYRNLGLDKSFIVIQDLGEYIMCMDSANDNPCVYSWDRSDPKFKKEYNSFTEYLIDVFQEGIDNL
jgi:hypothetical protein